MSQTYEEEREELIELVSRFRDSAFPVTVNIQYQTRPGLSYGATSKGMSKKELYAAVALLAYCLLGKDPVIAADLAKKASDCLEKEFVNESHPK